MVDILLIEDNRELAGLISTFLERDGYQTACVYSGSEAEAFLAEDWAKLILLDVMLPDTDGFQICTAIREKDDIPIIFMSARVDKVDKMNGFQLGADDYVEKPVDMDILCAKVKAVLYRNYERRQRSIIVYSGELTVDKKTRIVYYKKEPISLTGKEYELLLILIENEGKTLTKEYLFNKVWGLDSFSESQTLTVHIKMLRDKIERDSRKPQRIITVWGVGYRYEKI